MMNLLKTTLILSFIIYNNSDEKAKHSQHFGKDEDKDQTDKGSGLFDESTDTGVAQNAYGVARSYAATADYQAGGQMHRASKETVRFRGLHYLSEEEAKR